MADADATDGDWPVGSVPLFAPPAAPEISSTSHQALVKWRRERREYGSKLRARCRIYGEDYAAVVQSIKDSFNRDLLDGFCELRLGINSADVTDDLLSAEIERIVSHVKNDSLPDIKQLFKQKLRLNMAESDVDARVLDYFVRFKTLVDENGLGECFSGADGAREKCKRLIASLRPESLKADVKQCVRYTHKSAASDANQLFKLVIDKAKEQERSFQLAKKPKNDRAGRDTEAGKLTKPSKTQKKKWSGLTATANAEPSAKPSIKPSSTHKASLSSKRDLPPSPCPKCKEMHWLRECTKATDEEKAALRKSLRDARRSTKKARLKRFGELMPLPDRKVTLNGLLELPYCPDSGSEYTVIGNSHWELLCSMDSSAESVQLQVPIMNQAYGSTWVSANRMAKLQILIHTAAGPVRPMELWEVLITDVDDDEFIVGNDLLNALGIDVERQLEQLATRPEDESSGDPIALEDDDMPMPASEDDQPDGSGEDNIFAAVERLISRAVENGFPKERVEQLRTISHAYDIWRLELRGDPPASVPPLEVRLRDGARPTKCKPRKYAPHIRQFLRDFNDRLVALGMVYENPRSRWASPVLPVKKSAALLDLRQTTDYRVLNGQTEVLAAVMPILSVVVEHARGMKHFGLFDFLKGFWQLPLSELCQEFFSYMTDQKIFTPRRVPQGCSDAAIHFQKTMEECFSTLLYEHLLIWIDDLLLYAADMDMYLTKLAELFALLNTFGLKLNVKKSSLYQTKVKWCGRIINEHGVHHDPERIDTLRAMPYPQTAAELQQFLCGINWMRESLIDFARQVAPLQRRLDTALAKTKRTKRAAATIAMELNEEERTAFDRVKEMLASSATLDFPDDQATTCLFSDASSDGWAVIVTQVANFDPKLPATKQQHRLLHCMSGTFSGSQLNWSVMEKEALPIVMACDKLDYLLLRAKPFRLYCDHRNLIHVFAPHESVKKHIRGKLLRWAMKLMNFRYIVEHVPGPDNVWADMLSRWAGNHVARVSLKRIKSVPTQPRSSDPTSRPLRPLDDENFVWPTLSEIAEFQESHTSPSGAEQDANGVVTVNQRIWIPSGETDFIQRLCVVAQCGSQGHRGQQAMINHLQRLFSIDNLSKIVAEFLKQCRLCLHLRGGKIIPRPWSELIDCKERNGVLHFDFLYMGESYGSTKYILALKDHATHFCELVVADTADANVVTEALLAWHARYGIPPIWASDQGSHFKNEVIAELSRRLRTQQKFSPAYCPWINGSVERINRDILQVIRAMILSYRISSKDWVYLVPMVQANLNHTALPSLGNRAPVELFTGLQCSTPLNEFYLPGQGKFRDVPESGEIDKFLDELRSSLAEMHQDVSDQKLKQRLLNQKRRRGETLVNFAEGDYVLRSRVDEKHGDKLQVTWIGPYRILRADPHSFRIQHLITGSELDVHGSRSIKAVSDFFENNHLKGWLKNSVSARDAIGLTKLDDAGANIFAGPQWKTYSTYVTMLDKSNADTEMASSLMGHYGAEKVANMLAAAAKDPKTETIATNLEGGLIRFWKGLDTEPTEVFNILKLENKVDDVFDIPALAMWASYLKVYNEKHPAKPVSMTGVFAKYYGGETAFLKMLAKADDADSAGAKKLQNEVITAFRM